MSETTKPYLKNVYEIEARRKRDLIIGYTITVTEKATNYELATVDYILKYPSTLAVLRELIRAYEGSDEVAERLTNLVRDEWV